MLFIAMAILLSGCQKQTLTCKIVSPYDGQSVLIKNNLLIKVEAKDTKNTISNVTIYYSNPLSSFAAEPFVITSEPYTRLIPSKSLMLGKLVIRAVATNSKGDQEESSVTVNVVEKLGGEQESPNFVNFSDGKLPAGWITYTWEIDNTTGHNDNYSLRSANYPEALVFTKKTMAAPGCVEFYTKGGTIELFIDNAKAEAFSSAPDGSWTKRVYKFEKGKHEFQWKAVGISSYLDDIRFYLAE